MKKEEIIEAILKYNVNTYDNFYKKVVINNKWSKRELNKLENIVLHDILRSLRNKNNFDN